MEIPMDYHLLFIAMTFILFILSIFLLFINTSLEKAVAANILCMFNMILSLVVAYSFAAIDMYGFDSAGAVVHNVYSEMYPFIYLYWAVFYINLMLIFYCVYLYLRKPWEEYMKGGSVEDQAQYYD